MGSICDTPSLLDPLTASYLHRPHALSACHVWLLMMHPKPRQGAEVL